MRSTAPFAVSAAPSRARGRWLRAPVCRARRFGYSNDAAGRRTAISRSGEAFGDLSGAVDAYGYNLRSEVVSARRTKDGAPVRGFDEDFSYDPIGNRIATTNYDETGAAIVSEYSANNLNQYTSRTVPGVAAVRGFADADATVTVNESPTWRLGEYIYGSDEFDNSQSAVDAALVTTAALASPTNGPDEVASVTSRVHIAKSPQTFEYDDDGNQTLVATKTGTWRVTYNGENRPVRWTRINAANTNDQMAVLMSFDHQGRRRMYLETAADGSTNSLDRFIYDNYLCIARNRWQPGGTIATDRFVWDPTELVATRPLAFYQPNAQPQLYSIDGNKNVSELVSASDGSISAHYEYAPFGEVILSSGDLALTNPFRFSSEYADDTIALIYYNYRHYDSIAGRWINRDMAEYLGGIGLYVWCNNDCAAVDFIGLKCYKQGGAGFSRPFESQIGVGISVSASGTVSGMGYDCCCDGRMIYGEAYDIGITGQVTLGLGVGAHVKLPFVGTIGGTIEGPKYAWNVAAHVIKECEEEDRYWDITIFEWVGKLGGGGVMGVAFGVSAGYWLNYHVGAHLIIDHGDVSLKVIVGTDRGLDTSVETPLGNFDWEFFHHDETQGVK